MFDTESDDTGAARAELLEDVRQTLENLDLQLARTSDPRREAEARRRAPAAATRGDNASGWRAYAASLERAVGEVIRGERQDTAAREARLERRVAELEARLAVLEGKRSGSLAVVVRDAG